MPPMPPTCHTCGTPLRPDAVFLVAQEQPTGRFRADTRVVWVVVCEDHARGWYEGADIDGPTYRLKINPFAE
jgi:hypothetical protein